METKQRKINYTLKTFLVFEQFGKATLKKLNKESGWENFVLREDPFWREEPFWSLLKTKFLEKGFHIGVTPYQSVLVDAGLLLDVPRNDGSIFSTNGRNLYNACFGCENPLDTSKDTFNFKTWQKLILQYFLAAYPNEKSQKSIALKTGFSEGVVSNVLRLSGNQLEEPKVEPKVTETSNTNQYLITVPDTFKSELTILSKFQKKTPQQYLETTVIKQLQVDTNKLRNAINKIEVANQ